jgi:amidohydrolase family protein
MQIPVKKYLDYALQFNLEEEKFCTQFAEWLPDQIIDCHAHCNLAEHVNYVSERALGHMLSTFTHYSLEVSKRIKERMYMGKDVRTLRFAKTFEGIDHRAANSYLLSESPPNDRVAIFGLPEDVPYTTKMLRHPRCTALKMYWSYVNPPAQTIYEFFRPEILEEAQALDIPIILHLPKMIVRSLDDLLQMLADFPKLRVVLAHLGLSKILVPGLSEAFERVRGNENVVLDTALNPSGDVMSLALSVFGSERIMFGSDEPLNLIRSVAFKHPELGERIVTDYLYHWVDPTEHEEFKHLAVNVTHAHWQSVGAIKEAIERLPLTEQETVRQRVFLSNAEAFFCF